jgi:hypothetical protein
MCFSAQLQKQGIKTFVPPHTITDKTLWGSLPEYATKFGQSYCALSLTPNNHRKMNWAVNKLLEQNWMPLIKTKPDYVKKIKKELLAATSQKKIENKLFGKIKYNNKTAFYFLFLPIIKIKKAQKKKKFIFWALRFFRMFLPPSMNL